MVIRTSRRNVRTGQAVRLALLVPLAALIAHDAIFETDAARAGSAAVSGYVSHGYWPIFGLIVGLLTLSVVGAGLRRIAALSRQVRSHESSRPASHDGGYHRELLRVWAVLFPLTSLFFLVQENLEGLAAGAGLAGLGPIDGSQHEITIPLLAMASLAVAAVGAFVRWRTHVLEGRLRQLGATAPRRTPSRVRPVGAWQLIAAVCRYRWILLRPDPGRAPPLA